MTENLAKMPAKGILRKSSLTFIEHDDSEIQITLETEKPSKVIVEPVQTPPKEYPGETEEEKVKREEFEYKRRLYRHEEGVSVQLAKRLLSQEEDIEEEAETTTEDDGISEGSDDVVEYNEGNDEDNVEGTSDGAEEDTKNSTDSGGRVAPYTV